MLNEKSNYRQPSEILQPKNSATDSERAMNALRGKTFFLDGSRKAYPYINSVIINNYATRNNHFDISTICCFSFSENDTVEWFYAIETPDIFDSYLEKALNNESFMKFCHESLDTNTEQCLHDIEKKDIERFFLHLGNLMRIAGTLRKMDKALLSRLNRIDIDIQTLCSTTKLTKTLEMQKRLLELKMASKEKRPSFSDDLRAFYEEYKYSHVGYHQYRVPTLEELESEICNHEDTQDQHYHIMEERIKTIERRTRILDEVPEMIKRLAEIGSESTYLKDYYKYQVSKAIYHAEPLFEKIATGCGVSVDEIKHYLFQDIIIAAKTRRRGKRISSINCLVPAEDKVVLLENGSATRAYALTETANKGEEFKGRPACNGFVRGTAKIVRGINEFAKFLPGDILITSNTSPDFVPLLKNAKGIVGEEGGITAHISVISREMNIPCVVGIAKITKQIRDNDVVEIDAFNGIVKVIKRAAK